MISIRPVARQIRIVPFALLLVSVISCSVNPFDETQVPDVAVDQSGDELRITWSPQGAYDVRILEGEVDINDPDNTRPPSRGRVWSLTKFSKSVQSPVIYGAVQEGTEESGTAPELVSGTTYSVYVLREDPEGSGSGFTNTHNNYEAVITFVRE